MTASGVFDGPGREGRSHDGLVVSRSARSDIGREERRWSKRRTIRALLSEVTRARKRSVV